MLGWQVQDDCRREDWTRGWRRQRTTAPVDDDAREWRRQGMTAPGDNGARGWLCWWMTAPVDEGAIGWRHQRTPALVDDGAERCSLGGDFFCGRFPKGGLIYCMRVTARGGWQLCKDDDFRERWPRAVLSSTSLPDCRCLQWRRVAHGRDARAQTPGPGSDPRTAQSFAKKETTTF